MLPDKLGVLWHGTDLIEGISETLGFLRKLARSQDGRFVSIIRVLGKADRVCDQQQHKVTTLVFKKVQ